MNKTMTPRHKLEALACVVIEEARNRTLFAEDMYTGKPWPDPATFRALFAAVSKLAHGEHPRRKTRDTKGLSSLEKMERVLEDMEAGRISPQEAKAEQEVILMWAEAGELKELAAALDAIEAQMP